MKALGIVAIVVAAISIVIPFFGATYLPIIAGIMAVIAVKEESTLAFVALGINIVNVAFLSASIRLADAACDVMSDISAGMEEWTGESYGNATCDGSGAFWTWMGINIALLAVAVGIQLMNKKA